jgi:type III secretion protein F
MYVSDSGANAPIPECDGFLSKMGKGFDTGVSTMQSNLDSALSALYKDPSNPTALATYQQELSEYNLYRNAQSNTVKAYKDTSSAIVSNFR